MSSRRLDYLDIAPPAVNWGVDYGSSQLCTLVEFLTLKYSDPDGGNIMSFKRSSDGSIN